jgi:transaldolase
MKFFIDTANLDQIQQAKELGVLDGVTTNPSLMAKEGIKGDAAILAHYKKICQLVSGDVSAEVIGTDFATMVKEGKILADLAPNIVVKVPMTADGVKAICHFTSLGIRTNCTLIFSAGQAILAAKAGAINWEGMQLIRDIADIYTIQGYETEILAASIRNSRHIVDAARSGADVVTCPLSAIMGLLDHPLTTMGLEKFLSDYNKSQA